jgi:hypothetical protein
MNWAEYFKKGPLAVEHKLVSLTIKPLVEKF